LDVYPPLSWLRCLPSVLSPYFFLVCICLTRITDDTRRLHSFEFFSTHFPGLCLCVFGWIKVRDLMTRGGRWVAPFNDSEWKSRVNFSSFLPLPYPKGILDVCISLSPFQDSWSVSKFVSSSCFFLLVATSWLMDVQVTWRRKREVSNPFSILIPSLETSERASEWREVKTTKSDSFFSFLLLPQVMSYRQDVSLSIILMTVTAPYPWPFAYSVTFFVVSDQCCYAHLSFVVEESRESIMCHVLCFLPIPFTCYDTPRTTRKWIAN
jgi:hypothetical protein